MVVVAAHARRLVATGARVRAQLAAPARRLYSQKSYASELERTLCTQDPHDRILFEQPLGLTGFSGEFTLRRLASKAERVTAHLLPFYVITLISHLRWYSYDASTGRRPFRMRHKKDSYSTLEGCTVAAVPRDHWAFGVATNDDLIDYTGGPRLRDLPENKGKYSDDSFFNWGDKLYPSAYEGWNLLSNSLEGYHDKVALGAQTISPLEWDEFSKDTAPLFEFGPPQLTRHEQETIVQRQTNYQEKDEGLVEGVTLEEDMEVYACPQYRLVYRADLPDGGITILDASDICPKRMWRLDQFSPTSLTRRGSYATSKLWQVNEIGRFWRNNDFQKLPSAPLSLLWNSGTDVKTDALYNIILNSMLRNPVSKETWENPNILPIKNLSQPGVKDGAALRNYATLNCMLGADKPPAPAFFASSAKSTLSPHLQKKKAAATAPPPPPPPPPPGKESPQARLGHGRVAASRQHLLQSRHSEAARQSLTRRVAEQVERQNRWQSMAEQQAKQAREEAKRRADAEKQKAAADGRQLPLERPVSDKKGYYKVLGITATRDFIDYTMETVINRRIKEKRNQMIVAYHPDYSTSPAEEDQRTDRTAEINVAFDHLETCELRVKYHNAHRR